MTKEWPVLAYFSIVGTTGITLEENWDNFWDSKFK